MAEKKEGPKDSGICFDGISLAELQRRMGNEGIGSLCKEMMGRMAGTEKGESACLQFMRKVLMEQSNTHEDREESGKQGQRDSKEDHRRDS